MTVCEALMSVSAYPIPHRTIEATALKRGVDLCAEYSSVVAMSADYRLCLADLYMWLFLSPNVGQGGQSYSFNERKLFKAMAAKIYAELGSEADMASCGSDYGYKGSKL